MSAAVTQADPSARDRRVPRLLLALAVVGLLVDAYVVRSTGDAVTLLVPISFLTVGALVTRREPANVEGRLLLGVGLAWALILVTPFPGAWVVPVGLMGTHLILRFPDGRLPSPRWRWFSYWCTFMIVALTVIITTASRLNDDGSVNPYFVSWTQGLAILLAALPLTLVTCVVSVVVRYRRANDTARAQIRWLAAAAAAIAVIYTAALTVSFTYDAMYQIESTKSSWFQSHYPWWVLTLEMAALMSFMLIPLAFGVAILRYRLYDIDRLISRSTSYLLVSGTVVAVYEVTVTLISRLAPSSSSLAVAAATLVAAAAFRPVLIRVRNAVDRRFDRARYDGQRAVDQFGTDLRQVVNPQEVTDSLLAVVDDALAPAQASLWLREAR